MVSRAYKDAYYRRRNEINQTVEHLQYLPPGQPQDDLWSGSLTDTRFWMSNSDAIIGRQRLPVSRAQRRIIDGQPDRGLDIPANATFFENTKSRSRGQSASQTLR